MGKSLASIRQEVTELMGTAIAQFTSNPRASSKAKQKAHELFADTSLEHGRWADRFAPEYNALLRQYNDLFPKRSGHYVTRSREIGYTGYSYQVWIDDKPKKKSAGK